MQEVDVTRIEHKIMLQNKKQNKNLFKQLYMYSFIMVTKVVKIELKTRKKNSFGKKLLKWK